jgi:hypothetical protein
MVGPQHFLNFHLSLNSTQLNSPSRYPSATTSSSIQSNEQSKRIRPEINMSFAFNKFSSAPGAAHYQHDHRQRIQQQQGVGQTLPPLPVGSEPHNTPPPPPGAMSPGTEVVVGRHKVVIQVYLAEGMLPGKEQCVVIWHQLTFCLP